MNSKCIISLATKNSRYVDGLARLSNSLRDNADGIDFLGFIHERGVDAPLHTENPYGFKVYALAKSVGLGYRQILWLDASVWAVAPVQPIFDIISEQGYFFEGDGCFLGEWSNDKTLGYFGINRDAAMSIPMAQGGFMGFNMDNPFGEKLFYQLNHAYDAGLFKGNWNNVDGSESADIRVKGHRHDQSSISSILHTMGLPFSPTSEYIQYGGLYDKILNEKIVFKCQGL